MRGRFLRLLILFCCKGYLLDRLILYKFLIFTTLKSLLFFAGARLLEVEHFSRLAALQRLAECQVELGLYAAAVSTVDELWAVHMKSAVDPEYVIFLMSLMFFWVKNVYKKFGM